MRSLEGAEAHGAGSDHDVADAQVWVMASRGSLIDDRDGMVPIDGQGGGGSGVGRAHHGSRHNHGVAVNGSARERPRANGLALDAFQRFEEAGSLHPERALNQHRRQARRRSPGEGRSRQEEGSAHCDDHKPGHGEPSGQHFAVLRFLPRDPRFLAFSM